MEPSMITASGAVIAACIAFASAVAVARAGQRAQAKEKRTEWLHDRRKDAYLHFMKAARAFAPLTQEAFRNQHRDSALINSQNIVKNTRTGEQIPFESVVMLAGGNLDNTWMQRAPELLHALAVAFDAVDLEGPEKVRDVAWRVVESAHQLSEGYKGFELLARDMEMEAKVEGKEPTSTADELMWAEVYRYSVQCADFRLEVKVALKL
ncbi:hypothetical protein KVH02_26955 [Streptomyces olivaceus]|uniref:Uncharacterized protein n=1 Tax=Streptomyces olivaceus TaxID=47716 RepID=A0ABS7W924_STROV|nr:hypothetical protein [Streptomyces olivaceus]MBZ6091930.1 hypothetical protein [Streptomyces olivaceus]MBZ6098946.1 hypothetical protein [Streptomyces olivaceus]MBZ6118998.1 hypothetical protein [Streptomyces olivaceus]MBZ6154431.1 hypothetical protein [Streptomyces olivaceus]MBZ6300271.1 hypothetical protein [Streptomyces olivaceus]